MGSRTEGGERWRYLVVSEGLDEQRLHARCNELGEQGWELVEAVPVAEQSFGRSPAGKLLGGISGTPAVVVTASLRLFFRRRVPAS